jgi:hypothetical protein
MGERFGPARVQYGDWRGTVALDNPDDQADLYRLAGIDPDEWLVCGIEIHRLEVAGIEGSILALRRDMIAEFDDWEKVADSFGGAVPVTEFVFREGLTMAILAQFKRVDIRASLRHALEDQNLELEVTNTVYPPE